MSESIDELKAKIKEYEKRLGINEYDPAKDGYLILVDLLRQTNEYLKTFKIKEKIGSDDKSVMAEYKNAKDLWEGLPERIRSVRDLKLELKMEGEQVKNLYTRTSPKSIADGTANV